MKRATILAKLAEIDLSAAVDVLDVSDAKGNVRRAFTFRDPTGYALCEVTIDDEPTADQLEALARRLPIPAGKRIAAIAKLRALAAVQQIRV